MSVPIRLLWSLGEKKGIEESRESTASIDTSDALNWKTTPILLAVCAFIIGGSQAFGDPITCIYPAEIKAWHTYLTSYCYLNGSYSVHGDHTVEQVAMMNVDNRRVFKEANPIDYYQWIPFFLAFQLICFVVPGLVWRWARKRQALDLDTILEQIQGINELMGDSEKREEKMKDLTEYLYETLRTSVLSTSREHHSLTLLFLTTKILTLINVIYQFIFLVSFIGEDGVFFGYEIIMAFLDGAASSRYFPLQVLCDFYLARIGQPLMYTLQCFLSLNFFHDKMFGILWAWYLFLIVYSVVSFIIFSFSLLPLESFIQSSVSPSLYRTDKYNVRRFYNKMLFTDGMVILKFISKLKGRHLAIEIAERLYVKFEQEEAISAWIYPSSLKTKSRSKVIEE